VNGAFHAASDAAGHNYTFGLDEILGPLLPAALDTLINGGQFTDNYTKEQQVMQQTRHQGEAEHPIASIAGGLIGGIAGGSPVTGAGGLAATIASRGAAPAAVHGLQDLYTSAPSLAARFVRNGVPISLAKPAAAASNLAVSTGIGAGTGALMSEGSLEDRAKAAVKGAGLGAVLHAAVPLNVGAVSRFGRMVRPSRQAGRLTGQVLNETAAGTTFRQSPTPGVPLNVAQAAEPGQAQGKLASLVHQRAHENVEAGKTLRDQQNRAMLGALPRSNPRGAAPEQVAGDASTRGVAGVRTAAKIIRSEEKRLWNRPSLTKPTISTETAKGMVKAEVAAIHADTPGLALALDESPALKRVMHELETLPEKAAANQINAISSRLRAIARNFTEAGDVRHIATRLANKVQEGIWQAPEVAGRAASSYKPTYPQPGWEQAALHGTTIPIPGIKPDPQLVRDLTAARAFTQREAQVLGHNSFDAILRRNSQGNLTATPGTALNKFFDFANGVERPGSIANVTKFLGDIRSSWQQLSAAERAGTFDPAQITPVMHELVQNARDFMIAKMLGAVSTANTDAAGNRLIAWAQASKFMEKNRAMFQASGMFTPAQMDALQRWGDTARMIARGNELGAPPGSPTFKLLTGSRWMDLFIHPFTRTVGSMAVDGAVATSIGALFGDAGLGAILGVVDHGKIGQALLDRLLTVPKERLLEKMDEAIRDPQLAASLMQQFSSPKPMSPEMIAWWRSVLATEVPAQTLSGSPSR
jgi:hypothetical protein